MEDYFFFLGRNPDLSLQEIISFFEARGIEGKFHLESNIACFSLDKQINPDELINKLGGTIKIGKALISDKNQEKFLSSIEKSNLYSGEENKLKFTITIYPKEEEQISAALKETLYDFFKNEGIKAYYKQPSENPTESIKFDIEYFAVQLKGIYYFGKIDAVYDAKNVEFRDMHKPFRRSEYAISPRIAKILINLCGATEETLLLDPFCGVGTILQEAMLNNINVIGSDVDPGIIENCKRNIAWLCKTYQIKAGAKIFTSNAIDVPKVLKEKAEAIASEPFLIPLITYTPKKKEARKMLNRAKYVYITTLNELKKILKDGGRIALSLPVMKSREGKERLNIEEVCTETGLKLIAGPFSEARKDQRVERELVILEK